MGDSEGEIKGGRGRRGKKEGGKEKGKMRGSFAPIRGSVA